jgi:hypothetical protein
MLIFQSQSAIRLIITSRLQFAEQPFIIKTQSRFLPKSLFTSAAVTDDRRQPDKAQITFLPPTAF